MYCADVPSVSQQVADTCGTAFICIHRICNKLCWEVYHVKSRSNSFCDRFKLDFVKANQYCRCSNEGPLISVVAPVSVLALAQTKRNALHSDHLPCSTLAPTSGTIISMDCSTAQGAGRRIRI